MSTHTHDELHNSVQLGPGQKFHHQGKNGVVYFSLDVQEMPDGSIYPMTRTAPACNILPVELDANGFITHVYLLKQEGRPEVGEGSVLKAGGSFCAVGELGSGAALRALTQRMGVQGTEEDLIFVGKSYGFGPQFEFPIELFVITQFAIDQNATLMAGCSRVRMSIEELAEAQRDRKFFNSETVDLIATILLRNASRNTFRW